MYSAISWYGSSPRARGTRVDGLEHHVAGRFIPAGAGNTCSGRYSAWRRSVHPRGRGEHAGSRSASVTLHGSSPRARGTRQRRVAFGDGARFIPAGAGNTSAVWSVAPRWCGSSPRARGTLHQREGDRRFGRFIPAGAGNTIFPMPSCDQCRVHPRGRGEHSRRRFARYFPTGSSPRARGTRRAVALEVGGGRFIPAGAGNTRRETCGRA